MSKTLKNKKENLSRKEIDGAKKKSHEVCERVYNTCLSYGFTPYDEHNPFAPGSALIQTARMTQQKREKILELLKDNLIIEDLKNYNHDDPHDLLMRTLRQAGIEPFDPLSSPTGSKTYELVDIESLSTKDEIRSALQDTLDELTRAQRTLSQKETALKKQQDIVKDLKKQNKNYSGNARTVDEVYVKLSEQFIRPVEKLTFPAIPKSDKIQPLFACGILSDLHISETVKPEEVMGISAYNPDIAEERLRQFTHSFIEICEDHKSKKTEYQGCVINIAGDVISGAIHDELAKTNRTRKKKDPFGQETADTASSFDAAFEAHELLIPVIEKLRDHFGIIKVPFVVGNHGRASEKVVYKGHVHDSFDYLVGKLLQSYFAGDKKVEIILSESTDLIYDIYNSRFLLTHGDRLGVKGGDGIIGALGPIMRGNKKVRDHLSNYGVTYNYMLMAHFHQYLTLSNLVVNGSLVGPSAFSNDMRMNPEPPQQALFMVHPKRGILYHHAVVCDYMYKSPRTSPLVDPPPKEANLNEPFRVMLGHQGAKPITKAASPT